MTNRLFARFFGTFAQSKPTNARVATSSNKMRFSSDLGEKNDVWGELGENRHNTILFQQITPTVN
jgi:hypothetical protein